MASEAKPSPLRLVPARKKLKFSSDDHQCVICGETNGVLTKGSTLGVNSVMIAAQQRKDETQMRILKIQTDSEHPQETSFSYHRSCFKKYTSKRNVKFSHMEEHLNESVVDTDFQIASTSTRSAKSLQWTSCLICGLKKHKKDKTLQVIQSFERSEDLLAAATKLSDYDVLGRIQGEDLIAKDGLYHETCMKRYLRRLSQPAKTDSEITDSSSIYDASFLQLVDDIEHDLFIEGRALSMSKLTSRFNELINENSAADVSAYKGDRLKTRLCTYYGDRISVHRLAGKGSPNIILSSKISLANAIHAAQQLKTELQMSKCADEEETILTDCLSDDDVHRELLPTGYGQTDSQLIPVWTGYHRQKSARCENYTQVGYAPMVDAKPADMATVYTTMVKCKEMTEALGQRYAIQTMDQQLYAVAQQVKWSRPEEFKNHILRLGGFHTVQCFTAAIGKLWGDAGLLDLLVDSGVYAASTAESMLSGKQYHRAIRGLTMTYEVLMEAFISQFLSWHAISDTRSEIPPELWKTLTDEHNHFIDQSQNDSDTKHLEDTVEVLLEPLLEQFRKWGKEQSPTFAYWSTYLDVIQILLANIRAEREGDWQMHLVTQRAMLPFLFAANRINYARYLPVYLLDMISMPDVVRDEFLKGHHVYREKQGKFNGLWSDMGVEKTVIRDSKSEGGVVGLTRKPAALLRWTLTRHVMGDYTSVMSNRSSSLRGAEVTSCEETASRASSRDEHDVVSMYSYLVNNMTNPFDADHHPDVLINISTGVHAAKD